MIWQTRSHFDKRTRLSRIIFSCSSYDGRGDIFVKNYSEGTYLDGTIGLGGHSNSILSQLSEKGHLVGIDRDVQALEICKKRTLTKHSNFSLLKGSYSSIQNILDQLGVLEVNGMLLDLGLSSFQLDNHKEDFHLKQMEILI